MTNAYPAIPPLFFNNVPDGFIRDLCKRLLSQLYVPGEIIVKKGHPGKEMYLISSGLVAVEGDMGQRFAVLKSGQHFGEMGKLWRCTCNTNHKYVVANI